MDLLGIIILMSTVLAGVAVLGMLILIIQRWHKNRLAAAEARQLDVLSALAFEYLETPAFYPAFKAQLLPKDQALLIRLFLSLLPKVRGGYADQLVAMMRELGVAETCLGQLRSSRWWRRAEACSVLGAFNQPAVLAGLRQAVDDPVFDVRLEAARSLTRLGAAPPVRLLIERLVTHEAAHSLAVTELLQQQGPAAVAEMIDLLGSDADGAAKVLAADALGHIGNLEAVPALLRQCVAADELQRLSAFIALTALGDPRAAAAAAAALRQDAAAEVRTQAAICLGRIGGSDFAPDLEQSLADDAWWVRYEAATALFAIGGDGISRLQKAVQGPSQPAALIAHELLQEKGLAA